MRRQQLDQASTILDQLQEIESDLPFYLFTKAEIAFRADDFDQTLALLRKRAEKLGSTQLPEITLIDWYRKDQKPEKAEQLLGETLQKNPDVAELHLMTASMHLQKEQFPDALVSVSKFERLSRETNLSIDIKARVAFAGQSYGVAESHFKKLIDRVPSDLSIRNIYALCLIESEDPEKRKLAKKISELVARQLGRNPLAAATLGYILLKTDNMPAANQIMNRIVATQSGSAEVTYLIAQWQYEVGQKESAGKLLEKIVGVNSLFLYRSAAKSLLQKIKSETASESGTK